jgi:hypothetical protein
VNRHVDEQTLAAFREGLLSARQAARITAHLATCQRCAEVDAQLAAVTTVLARTPAPPMPATLAARLDAALAAEIARSAAAAPSEAVSPAGAATPAGVASPAGAPPPAGAPSPAGETAAGGHAGRRDRPPAGRDPAGRRGGSGRAPWRLSRRVAAAAAAAVVILAGGGYAVAHALSAGHSGTSASAPGAASSRSAISKPALGPRPAPAAPAIVLPLIASGTHYQRGQLPAQVGAVLRRYAPQGSPSRARPAPAGSAAAFPHLAACVAHVAGGEHPRLVDIAHYGNRPAAVIVVPVPGTANVHVWVVGPGCSAQGSHLITQLSMPAPG